MEDCLSVASEADQKIQCDTNLTYKFLIQVSSSMFAQAPKNTRSATNLSQENEEKRIKHEEPHSKWSIFLLRRMKEHTQKMKNSSNNSKLSKFLVSLVTQWELHSYFTSELIWHFGAYHVIKCLQWCHDGMTKRMVAEASKIIFLKQVDWCSWQRKEECWMKPKAKTCKII